MNCGRKRRISRKKDALTCLVWTAADGNHITMAVELPIQLTPLWCIALSYKRIMTTTLQLLLPVFLVTR